MLFITDKYKIIFAIKHFNNILNNSFTINFNQWFRYSIASSTKSFAKA